MSIYTSFLKYSLVIKSILVLLAIVTIIFFLLSSNFIFFDLQKSSNINDEIPSPVVEEKKVIIEPEIPSPVVEKKVIIEPEIPSPIVEKKVIIEPETPSPLVQEKKVIIEPEVPEIIALVMSQIISDKNISSAEIDFIKFEEKVWNSSALGCPIEGMMYAQVQVKGYKIHYLIKNTENIIHSDYDGRFINCTEIEHRNMSSSYNFSEIFNLQNTNLIILELAIDNRLIAEINDLDEINEIIDKLNTEVIISGAETCQHKYNLIFYKNTDKTSFGILCDNNLNYVYSNSPLEGTNIFLKIIEPLLSNLEFPGMPKNE